MKSRFGFPVPIDGLDDAKLISLLSRLGEKLPTPGVLLPTGDAYVLLLSRHEEMLARWFRFALADRDTLENLADKRRQFGVAARCGIPIPRTLAPESVEDLRRVPTEIGFPCIIKPAFSRLWRQHQANQGRHGPAKLAVAETPAELLRQYARMNADDQGVIVQEQVEGPADRLYAVYAYCANKGEASALMIRREFRDWPVDYGNGSFSMSVSDPEVEALARRFFARTGYRGLANIEFKRDARDGEVKLIEFNVRGASQLALAVDSGVDLPFVAYCDLTGAGTDNFRLSLAREGVRWIDLGLDAQSSREHRRRGNLRLREWVSDVLRARSFAYFARDDLRPAMARATELVRRSLAAPGRSRR
jgi:predicted ATP-grasp superfamily ATP-dependent carboligase